MSALSNYLEGKILDLTLRGQAFTPPATVHVALFSTDPTDAGSGTEISGNAYARAAVSTSGGFSAPSGGASNNLADITFPAATGTWGTITHVAIFDASSGGNLLYHGALQTPKIVNAGDTLRLPAGDLIVTLT